MASVQGWGRDTWGSAAWSEYSPVIVTGQQANGSIGTGFSVVTSQVISVTGQEHIPLAEEPAQLNLLFQN